MLRQLVEVFEARRGRAPPRPVAGAVKLVGSAAGDERHLWTARPSHLGVEIRGADAELLERLLGHADGRGVGRRELRVVDVDAVERDALLVGTGAGHRAVAWVDGGRIRGGNEDRARLQAEQVHHVLRLDWEAPNLLARYHVTHAGVDRVQLRAFGDDAHRFRNAANFECNILPGDGINLQLDAFDDRGLESTEFDFDVVPARLHAAEAVGATLIADRRLRRARADVTERDAGARNHLLLGVRDVADQGRRARLRPGGAGNELEQ